MKKILYLIIISLFFISCGKKERKITLYGEIHAEKEIYDREIEIIDEFYKNGGRTLFLEAGYCQGEILNSWMESDNDEGLDLIFKIYEGTTLSSEVYYDYYKTIKEKFPEIRFIGTDIEHVYGNKDKIEMFEDYFFKNIYPDLDDDEKALADKSIAQGKECYAHRTNYNILSARELMMGPNMIDAIKRTDENIIGFYGKAHLFGKFREKIMVDQVREEFPWIKTVDLTMDFEPPVIETKEIEIAGDKYEADLLMKGNYGRNNEHGETRSLEIYRVKNAENLKIRDKTGKLMPYYNLAFKINEGDVFFIRKNIEGGVPVDSLYHAKEGFVDEEGYPALEELDLY